MTKDSDLADEQSDTKLSEHKLQCRNELHEQFTPWRTFVLLITIQVTLCVGCYGFAWLLYILGSGRATVSESRSADVQRTVDKADVRGEGMELTLSDVRQILRGIQTDLLRVEKTVIRLEARNERLDPLPKP